MDPSQLVKDRQMNFLTTEDTEKEAEFGSLTGKIIGAAIDIRSSAIVVFEVV